MLVELIGELRESGEDEVLNEVEIVELLNKCIRKLETVWQLVDTFVDGPSPPDRAEILILTINIVHGATWPAPVVQLGETPGFITQYGVHARFVDQLRRTGAPNCSKRTACDAKGRKLVECMGFGGSSTGQTVVHRIH